MFDEENICENKAYNKPAGSDYQYLEVDNRDEQLPISACVNSAINNASMTLGKSCLCLLSLCALLRGNTHQITFFRTRRTCWVGILIVK